MTDAAPTGNAPARPARDQRPRSFVAIVVADVLRRPGAVAGLIVVGVVAFCAVFAPVLANSAPLLMRADGRISSPMLSQLTATDVLVFALTPAALLLIGPRRVPMRWRVGLLLLAAAAASALVIPTVRPARVAPDTWRTLQAEGGVEWVVNAPVPYSSTDRLRDQPTLRHPLPPSWRHPLGTERQGADVLAGMIHACRIAIAIGFIATGIALVIGVVVGGLMGYFSGAVDLVGMRLVELFSAIPQMFLLLTFVAFFGRNLYLMMVIIGITGWIGYARFTRAEFLRLRQQDFVQAARACGLPLRSILFVHLLPNGLAPVLVQASFGVATAILAESFLSFLGLGLVDEQSWGKLLNQARGEVGAFYWWLATYPGLAIFLSVFAFNLIGEALRDALDPHLKRPTMA